jgi:hypothetical protein
MMADTLIREAVRAHRAAVAARKDYLAAVLYAESSEEVQYLRAVRRTADIEEFEARLAAQRDAVRRRISEGPYSHEEMAALMDEVAVAIVCADQEDAP